MNFEIRSWNTDKAAEVINFLLPGKNVYLDNVLLSGVEKVTIEKGEIMDSDPCPEEGYDGGLRDQIRIQFKMKGGGIVTRCFEPINEACTVHLESSELFIIEIIPLLDYAKRVKNELDERISMYEEFYKR